MSRVALFYLFAFSCLSCMNHGSSSNESSSGSNQTVKELCEENYCLAEIKEFDEDFLLSPVDSNFIGQDSDGNYLSTNSLLVKFNNDVSSSDVKDILDNLSGKISAFIPDVNIYEIRFDSDSVEQIERNIEFLSESGLAESVEKNYFLRQDRLDIEDSDLEGSYVWSGIWGLEKIKLAKAYEFIERNNIHLYPVKIAILDNGFDLNHKEFNGLKIADKFDFADNDNNVSPPLDENGKFNYHGTQVAGIMMAQNGNNGVNGIVFGTELMAYKIFPDNENIIFSFLGGAERSLLAAIIWAMKKKVSVINISSHISAYLHLVNPFNLLKLTVEKAYRDGIVIVASAGNGNGELYCQEDYWPEKCQIGDEATYHFPSAFPEVISVGAVDINDNRAKFSNYSQDNYTDILTLAAPGENLLLLGLNSSYLYNETGGTSGTSFASPMVAGLAGFLRQINPNSSSAEIRRVMYESAVEIIVEYPDYTFNSWRRINALEAVKKATAKMSLPNHGIGKQCSENSDCDFDLFCNWDVCTEHCYQEDDRGKDLGWSCGNCNLFCECPLGTACVSIRSPYGVSVGRLPTKICLLNCDRDSDCNNKEACWPSTAGKRGICLYNFRNNGQDGDCGDIVSNYAPVVCEAGLVCALYTDGSGLGVCQ